MSMFEGFDLGNARELRIQSVTLAGGQSAQLAAVVIELTLADSPEPHLISFDHGDDGPALATIEAMVGNQPPAAGAAGRAAVIVTDRGFTPFTCSNISTTANGSPCSMRSTRSARSSTRASMSACSGSFTPPR